MAAFTMPSLGADMEEGTLLEWLVKPGDDVHRGDIIAVVDTAKAAVEVEAFVDGVVETLLVEPGTTVPVGSPLALIGSGADTPAPPPEPEHRIEETHAQRVAGQVVASPLVRRVAGDLGVDLTEVIGTGIGGRVTRDDVTRAASAGPARRTGTDQARVRATPFARRLAADLGIDLSGLSGKTGPIRADDVRAAAAGKPVVTEPTPTGHTLHQDQMRSAIAALMSRAKREIPHYYLSTTVDLGRAQEWMHQRNSELPVTSRLVTAALLLKAVAVAVAGSPELNGFWVDGRFRPAPEVHLGIAVSLRGGGLVAPALHDAAHLSLDEVMAGMRDLVTRARAGRLRGSELSDPTITVTNLGEQGVESVFGVIYPPQVALVGVGRVVERPWATDGLVAVRPVTTLTLSGDHRATDGFTGARFLAAIDQQLQQPEDL